MKKLGAIFAALLGLFLVNSFAQGKQGPPLTTAMITQKIVIAGTPCQKLLSVKNDKTQPEKSLVQRYNVVCEENGRKHTIKIQVELNNKGEIIKKDIVATPKAWGGGFAIFAAKCEPGQVER